MTPHYKHGIIQQYQDLDRKTQDKSRDLGKCRVVFSLYWHIGDRINSEILKDKRAEYGKQIIVSLSRQLTKEYGKGWSERQLRYCIRFAEIFSDKKILHTVCRIELVASEAVDLYQRPSYPLFFTAG